MSAHLKLSMRLQREPKTLNHLYNLTGNEKKVDKIVSLSKG